jgi:hypothetical protein
MGLAAASLPKKEVSASDELRTKSTVELYATPEEVVARYRGSVTLATLANWRSLKIGPSFQKCGKSILYPIEALDAWDRQNLVTCNPANGTKRK